MSMRKRRVTRLTALLCALALALTLCPAALAAETPAVSANINKQDYGTYGSTVKSYLFQNGQGGLTRVEYIGGKVAVEDYDSSFRFTAGRQLQAELPIWGGFFAGSTANYLIFGKENPSESASAEVIRVVKYSKDWKRQGETVIKGADVRTPFDGGSVRCAEEGGYLYIHCARKMVKTRHTMYGPMSDGLNHQANLFLEIRESDMKLVDSYDQTWNLDFGYVSHAFNQFVLVDAEKNIVTLSHSDSDSSANAKKNRGYAQDVKARGAVLIRYDEKAGQDHFKGKHPYQWCEYSLVQGFGGASGNNNTGASLGGFEETEKGYVSAFSYDGKGGNGARSVYLGYTAKKGLASTSKKISTAPGVTTPQMVSTGLSGGYILWNGKSGSTPNDTLYYVSYSDGGTVGTVRTAKAPLSDCRPVLFGGKAVWYVTNNSAPVFYGLDASGVKVLGGGKTDQPAAPDQPGTPDKPASGELTVDVMFAPSTFSTYAAVTSDGTLYRWDSDEGKFVKLGSGYIAAGNRWGIKADHSLWVWNSYEPFVPKKLMDGAYTADFGSDVYGVLKTDGTLWGTDFTDPEHFKKMDSGVKQFFVEDTEGMGLCYAVSKNGDFSCRVVPEKESSVWLSGITAFSAGFNNSLFLRDGSLYYFGFATYGEYIPMESPRKVMDGAICFDAEGRSFVTSDGTLYGLDLQSGAHKKLMSDVVAVRNGMALKRDGTLWDIRIDGITLERSAPKKVLDNVRLPDGVAQSASSSAR